MREIARKMGIPPGTILSRAKRENWSLGAATARLKDDPGLCREILTPKQEEGTLSVSQAVALSLRERAEKYADEMAEATGERMLPYLRSLPIEELLAAADRVEKLDRIARRSFRLDDNQPMQSVINIGLLSGGLDALIANTPIIDVKPLG